MHHHTTRVNRVGLAPGVLLEDATQSPVQLRLVNYQGSRMKAPETVNLDIMQQLIAEPDGVTWLHIQGQPGKALLEDLGTRFGIHPLVLEDIQTRDHRPKFDEYPEHLFVILSVPRWQDGTVLLEQFSLLLGERSIISIHDSGQDITGMLCTRLSQSTAKLRTHGADYLFYALMDLVIDQAYPLLETFGTTVDQLEEHLVTHPDRETLPEIQNAKRTLIRIRRQLWPTREVISHLIRGVQNDQLLDEGLRPYLNDLYDHTITVMDMLETYRDVVTGLMDIYLSSVSNRLNEIMRTLTVISTLFIPLTFITGIYGMNFGSNTGSPWAMPELRMYLGYPMILGLMFSVAIGMLLFFKRRGWIFSGRRKKSP
jgi:magnesium transporter